MKIIAISDQHGNLPPIAPCDLLLIAGDITPATDHSWLFQTHWLNTYFRQWLNSLPAKKIIGVAGNHDFLFERSPQMVPLALPWTYLQDESAVYCGYKIYGTPHQPRFMDWAFNLDEPELTQKWAQIPLDTDIVVCHGPPYGYGDQAPRYDDNGKFTGYEKVGSPSLLERIEEVEPVLTVFGHLHSGRGSWWLNHSLLANVTLLNERYQMVYRPMEFELPTREQQEGTKS